MRAFAAKRFELDTRDKDGFSLRDKLEGLLDRSRNAKARAKYEADLRTPPFPMALLHVWNAFGRLSARRGSNGFAANPIGWPDIDAFLRHSGLRLAPWEISLIEQLDDLYRADSGKPKETEKED